MHSEKYQKVLHLRKNEHQDVFPAYLYDPQVHESDSLHWFGHPPNSLIVYCNVGSGLPEFVTNELGFRSASNQNLKKPIDLILIGDSYTEGACVNAPNDIASILGKDFNLLNLGRGGSGPLFQLGLFKELLQLVHLGEISIADDFNLVWIVIAGNDLKNLAEERQTKLSLYLNDKNYSQDYFHRLIHGKELAPAMRTFHDSVLAMPDTNAVNHDYGDTLIPGSHSEETALRDLANIIYQFNQLVISKGGKFNIVSLENHPLHNTPITRNTQNKLVKECSRLRINCLRFDLSDPTNKSSTRNHLNESEYRRLSANILSFLVSPDQSR